MEKKKNLIIMIGLIILALVIGTGITYYVMSGNEKECKKCNECKKCDICEVCSTTTADVFGDKYFDMLDNDSELYYTSDRRVDYLYSDWIAHNREMPNTFITSQEYQNFITKLETHFNNKSTYIGKTTTFNTIDNYAEVYIQLKTDGTFNLKENMCEGYISRDGSYKIINNEIVIMTVGDSKYMLFLYKGNYLLKSISYADCGSINSGTTLIQK